MTEQFASAHGKLFSGDRQCIENLKHGYATLLSIYDMHCSHYFLRNLVEWPKLGHMIQLMYEAEKVTGQEKYDPNWQRISDHKCSVVFLVMKTLLTGTYFHSQVSPSLQNKPSVNDKRACQIIHSLRHSYDVGSSGNGE